MHISKLVLENIRTFAGAIPFEFCSGINLLVGSNNCGKSTVIWPLTLMQPLQGQAPDWGQMFPGRRLKSNSNSVVIEFSGGDTGKYQHASEAFAENFWPEIKVALSPGVGVQILSTPRSTARGQFTHGVRPPNFPSSEPSNVFHYFLSRRKVVTFSHAVNANTT